MIATDRIRHFPLFQDLSDVLLDTVASFCTRQHYQRAELICSHGQPPTRFFLVEYGRVKVYRAGPDGREQVLHIVGPGESFGEVAVLSLDEFPASAQALEETAAVVVPRREFIALIDGQPEAARALLASQARWLRHLVDFASALTLHDVPTRLARFLVTWCRSNRVMVRDGAQVELDVAKTVVAARIGTIPETLSRALKKLETAGVITRAGKTITILDAEALHQAAFPDA